MGEVLEFKRKKLVDKIFIEVQTQVLEDHSIWYRMKIKSPKIIWSEWMKIEEKE